MSRILGTISMLLWFILLVLSAYTNVITFADYCIATLLLCIWGEVRGFRSDLQGKK
jgi:hypothetical protein